MIGREELLFSEVHNALCSLNISMKLPESRRQIADLEEMLQNEKIEFEVSSLDLYHLYEVSPLK